MFSLFRRSVVQQSPNAALLESVDSLRIDGVTRVFSPDNNAVVLTTRFRSVEELNQMLGHAINVSHTERSSAFVAIKNNEQKIRIQDWFIGSNGCYLNVHEQVILLQNRARSFIRRYGEMEELSSSAICQNHILHMSGLMNELREVFGKLTVVAGSSVPQESCVRERR